MTGKFSTFSQAQAVRRETGSTLMLALWAMLLLSAVVFGWVKLIDQGITILTQNNLSMEARALSHSGAAVAMHPNITRRSPLLEGSFSEGRSYRATIDGEGGKLNLNYFLAGEDPTRLEYLKRYFGLHGLNHEEQDVLVDCMLDWIAPGGGLRHPNGATDSDDYHPAHRPFLSLDEVAQVKGSAPLLSKAKWQDDFTLMSSGPLDLVYITGDALGKVPGVGQQRADSFIQARQKLAKTSKNDQIFRSAAEALSYLGMSQQQFGQLSGILGFGDPIVRIRSIGTAGKVDRQVDVIARKMPGSNPQILLWTEK